MTEFRLAVGGDVQAKGGTYIVRPDVDDALHEACKAHEFAYVLACRQIGKSSLKNATAERLMAEGLRVARLDLNIVGQQVKEHEIWYFTVLDQIGRDLGLRLDLDAWWEQQSDRLSMSSRFVRFFDDLVLPHIEQDVVIFIDEIDMTLGLAFTDDFFAAIRAMHNDRAKNPAYHRLTFVLLGVATPDELISDRNRTPFNIGRPIAMRDFTLAECAPFQAALATQQGADHFAAIYAWTNGHPYLTQKLCAEVMAALPNHEADLVDATVQKVFLNEEERAEDNLRFVQDRLLNDPQVRPMLQIYQQILQGKNVPDEEKSIPKNRLKLYGLVVAKGKWLKPRNRLYTTLFDGAWVRKNMPPLLENRYKWVSAALATMLVLFVGYVQYTRFVEGKEQECIRYELWQNDNGYVTIIQTMATIFELDNSSTITKITTNSLGYGGGLKIDGNQQILTGLQTIRSTTSSYVPESNITKCTEAIWWSSNNPALYLNRAKAYEETNNLTMALTDYDKAILVEPNIAHLYYQRGNFYFKMNNFEHAIVDYSKAISQRAEQGDAITNYVKKTNLISDGTESCYVIQDDYYEQRIKTYFNLGNYEKAIAEYENLIVKYQDGLSKMSCKGQNILKIKEIQAKIDELKARLQKSK